MRGNWIEMTATQVSANTNPTALAAVSNLPTWSDVFGSVGSRLVEYEMDDGAGHFECGYGSVNLATGVLSRDYPMATFDAGATPKYNASTPARLTTFSAGATVRCAPLASSVGGGESFHRTGAGGIGNGYLTSQTDVVYTTGLQGWRSYIGFLWTGTRPITSASIYVRNAATAGKLRVGLMEVSAPGVFNLVKEFTENSLFDLTLTGQQTISNFSRLSLPPGPYVLQFVQVGVSGNPQLAASPNNVSDRNSIFGRSGDGRVLNGALTDAGATTLATSFSGNPNGGFSTYSMCPLFVFGTE
jgi:hypothetical protein